MPPFHESYPGSLQERAPSLNVADGKVFLPMGVAKDVERVAGAMVQDAETIDLTDAEYEIAESVQSQLDERRRLARMQELHTVGMPVDELEVVVNGAASVIDGYHARRNQHFEDKQIPQEPESLTDRIKRAGATVTGFVIVVAGVNSPSGRSARRIRERFADSTIDKIVEKSEAQAKRTSYKPNLDEWGISLNGEFKPKAEPPVY